MAGGTLLGSWLIEEYLLVIHGFKQSMTPLAANILVDSFERQRRLAVIEKRRLPLVRVVAVGAVRVPCFGELRRMRIFVAVLANF